MATRLLQGGAASVVAMAYSVYAVAAAEFMAGFTSGCLPATGLRGGDRRTAATVPPDDRPSPKGTLPLADWLVPVHYLRRGSVSRTWRPRPPEALAGEALDSCPTTRPAARRGAGAGGGVHRPGRAFYELEPAFRRQGWSYCTARPGPARPSWPRRSRAGGKLPAGWNAGLGVLPFLRAWPGLFRPGRGDDRDRPQDVWAGFRALQDAAQRTDVLLGFYGTDGCC